MPAGLDSTGEALNALRFAARASKVKVVAKVSRYIDYEVMYNAAQKELDLKDQMCNHLALDVAEKKSIIELKDSEIETLKEELTTLRNRVRLEAQSHDNKPTHTDSILTEEKKEPAQVKFQVDDSICENEITSAEMEHESKLTLISQHSKDIELLKSKLEAKVSAYKRLAEDANQEVMVLNYDLTSSRQQHLSSLEDLRKLREKSTVQHREASVRLSEALTEVAEHRNKVEDLERQLQVTKIENMVIWHISNVLTLTNFPILARTSYTFSPLFRHLGD